MNDHRKWPLISIVSLGIGISTIFIAGRSIARVALRWRFLRKVNVIQKRLKEKLENPFPATTIVTRISEWDEVCSVLLRDCAEIPILGFDCEWVNFNGNTQPIALIQLASHQGICALVRVCCLSTLPETLKNILSNPKILKVGVATWEDASKLKKDFGIQFCGGFDVRHLILRHPKRLSLSARSGLSGLSEQLLGKALNKHYSVRCSDWEAENLSDVQVKYAAQDAVASIAICLKLIAETTLPDLNNRFWVINNMNEFYTSWAVTCAVLDTKFRMSSNHKFMGTSNSKGKKFTATKPNNSRAYAARKTALYDNCILQAPDGQQLCTCDYKKAMWYFAKGRGEVVCENPMTVRLNFEPAGRPSSEYDRYYLTDKVNKCVVCGRSESFLRKNIVPHEYRKHFPDHLKDHKSHDILLLCIECHTVCNTHENNVKNELSLKCEAPIGTERGVKTKLDKKLSGVQKAANALILNRHAIPSDRVAVLEDVIKSYYEVEDLTPEIMEMAKNLEVHVPNSDYVPHGLKVVHYFEREHPGGLLALERLWREHFLQTMRPRHLPALWSVEHYRKPEEKWGNNKTSVPESV